MQKPVHPRARSAARAAPTPHDDVLSGSAVGAVSGALLAALLGAAGPMLAFGAVLGLATGGVAGMLVWVSTADLPDAPIPPVRTADDARERGRRTP